MRRFHIACWVGILGCLTLLCGTPLQGQTPKAAFVCQGVAFVSTGTDFNAVPTNLIEALDHAGLPLTVQEVYWGSANLVTDGQHRGKHRETGAQLARRIWALRIASPQQRVCLIGYSEGAAVVLAAAENLPPGSVDRIILVAPEVPCRYDLRPALVAAREGIDCFFCGEDNYQELVSDVLGTPDDRRVWQAGRIGFYPAIATYEDYYLYRKLRQHRWSPEMEHVVRLGGHFAYGRVRFLENYVVPLLCQPQ